VCVQIRADWNLAAHMPCTGLGWGIIYPLIVHDKHPDIEAYDKLVGIDDIVMGDEQESVDPGAEARRKRQLAHVKQEEEQEIEEARRRMYDREPNPGIQQHTKTMQGKETEAHKAKKKRTAD
jgi:hypothetical protein